MRGWGSCGWSPILHTPTSMLNVPYIEQPDQNSCALACYVMVAKYFFPETTFEEIAQVSDWQKGYVIWPFKFWLWLLEKDIKIEDYDLIDAGKWANEGITGLKESVSEKEFDYYIKNTKDIDSYAADIKKVLQNPEFAYHKEKPTLQLLKDAVQSGTICEVVLNAGVLRDTSDFILHRVVVLDISDTEIIFHDPALGPNIQADKEKFENAWLSAVSEPELCIYKGV